MKTALARAFRIGWESAKADFRPLLVLWGFACLLTVGYFGIEPLRAAAGRDTFVSVLPLSRLAELLGLGRASLYRAFDALCAAGAIEKKQKNITIKDRAYLARVSGGTK